MITRISPVHLQQSLRRSATALRYNSNRAGPSKPTTRPQRAYRTEDYGLIPDVEDALSFGLGSESIRVRRKRNESLNIRVPEQMVERLRPHLKYNQYAQPFEVDDKDLDDFPLLETSEGIALENGQPPPTLEDSRDDTGERAVLPDSRDSKSRRIYLNPGPGSGDSDPSSHPGRVTLYISQGSIRYRSDATKHISFITYHRLRDGCPCPRCIDPSTRQRTHTSPEAYLEVENSPFTGEGVVGENLLRKETQDGVDGLRINWSDDHSAFYPLSRLEHLATGHGGAAQVAPIASRVFWDKDILLARQDDLIVRYDDLARPEARDANLLKLLIQVQKFGIVLVKGVPNEKTGNDDCTLREVMGWIGEIRNSFYGETWDVKNVANSKNVAYTNLNLGMHMDLLYFSSPPRFQALHCLRNRVEGGSSYFVDSFAAANKFLQMGHQSVPIDFEYDNDSHQLHHKQHLISGGHFQQLKSAVNWSPPFQGAPIPQTTGNSPSHQHHWYDQLAAFQQIIEEPHRKWEFLMEEGDLVLFDNRRVLHARRAFRDLTEEERKERGVEVVEGEPSRWLKGCYLDGEVIWDKLTTLARKLKSQSESESVSARIRDKYSSQ